VLSGIDAQRARWHEATAQAREDAQEATTELRRRFPDAGSLPLRDPHQRQEPEPGQDQAQDRERERATGQPELDLGLLSGQQRQEAGEDLRRAAEAAELARRTLDAREARARQTADREAQRQREEPSPARWPHRDPGNQPPRREPEPRTERTPAQLADLAFPDGPRPSPRPRDAPAAEPRHPRPRPRGPERDGPEASR
jgi:hypothetical protein